jgi:pectin methylesterase-like acyl-CoA thioesterase
LIEVFWIEEFMRTSRETIMDHLPSSAARAQSLLIFSIALLALIRNAAPLLGARPLHPRSAAMACSSPALAASSGESGFSPQIISSTFPIASAGICNESSSVIYVVDPDSGRLAAQDVVPSDYFATIQSAIDAVPDRNVDRITIYILAGAYW